MNAHLSPDQVADLYTSGVDAIIEISQRFDPTGWELPACGDWTAAETARHVLAVARWYHDWLDRALDGTLSVPFAASIIDAHTDAVVRDLARIPGPAAASTFGELARSYLDRARSHWEVPFAYPFGVSTVGHHARMAATEWHLHAFDLSRAVGPEHAPDDPASLLRAALEGTAAISGPIQRGAIRLLAPAIGRRDPWGTLCRRSGRR